MSASINNNILALCPANGYNSGQWENVTQWTNVLISGVSDQSGTILLNQCNQPIQGGLGVVSDSFPVVANTPFSQEFPIKANWLIIGYSNNDTAANIAIYTNFNMGSGCINNVNNAVNVNVLGGDLSFTGSIAGVVSLTGYNNNVIASPTGVYQSNIINESLAITNNALGQMTFSGGTDLRVYASVASMYAKDPSNQIAPVSCDGNGNLNVNCGVVSVTGSIGPTGNFTVSNDGSFLGPSGYISTHNDGSFFGPTAVIDTNLIGTPTVTAIINAFSGDLLNPCQLDGSNNLKTVVENFPSSQAVTGTVNIGNTGQFFGPTGYISTHNDGSFFGPTGVISVSGNILAGQTGPWAVSLSNVSNTVSNQLNVFDSNANGYLSNIQSNLNSVITSSNVNTKITNTQLPPTTLTGNNNNVLASQVGQYVTTLTGTNNYVALTGSSNIGIQALNGTSLLNVSCNGSGYMYTLATISGTPSVQISGTPTIDIAAGQTIGISNVTNTAANQLNVYDSNANGYLSNIQSNVISLSSAINTQSNYLNIYDLTPPNPTILNIFSGAIAGTNGAWYPSSGVSLAMIPKTSYVYLSINLNIAESFQIWASNQNTPPATGSIPSASQGFLISGLTTTYFQSFTNGCPFPYIYLRSTSSNTNTVIFSIAYN